MSAEGNKLMRAQIIESGVDTSELFRIESGKDGYFAVRERKPCFALFSTTIAGAASAAERALRFYHSNKDEAGR